MVIKLTLDYFNKKAQDVNLLFVVVIAIAIAMIIVVGYKGVKELNTVIKNLDVNQDVKDITQRVEDKYVTIWDMLFLVLFVFMIIILIASAFFIDTHPVFFIISLFVVFVSALVGGHLANAYSDFEANPSINTEASAFKVIPYIFKHYISIIVVVGMITTTVLFAKLKGGG